MASKEFYNERDLSYSAWHRVGSIKRFISEKDAKGLVMMDFDFVEYDYWTKEPVLYKELLRYENQTLNKINDKIYNNCKPYIVQARKTSFANEHGPNIRYIYKPPVYLVCYDCSILPNPANYRWPDIVEFRVMELWPEREEQLRVLTPREWARELVDRRKNWKKSWDKRLKLKEKENKYGKIL